MKKIQMLLLMFFRINIRALFDKNDTKISNAEDFKIDISGIKLGDAINKFSEKRC